MQLSIRRLVQSSPSLSFPLVRTPLPTYSTLLMGRGSREFGILEKDRFRMMSRYGLCYCRGKKGYYQHYAQRASTRKLIDNPI